LHLSKFLAEEENIHDAFQRLRGDAIESFTAFLNGKIADKMILSL
jgi:hypothetical protein